MPRPRNASTLLALATLTLLLLATPAPAPGATLTVGPSGQYATPCAAAAVAQDGDVVEIEAGTYPGDVCAWYANDLTIRGVGGHAHIPADGQNAQGKAIWVIDGDNTTVEWIEFSGCTVPDHNGAGIRQQGTGLTVRHCWFHDNENGILTTDDPLSDILIEYSEFGYNGYGDGLTHNLYVNHVRSLVFRYNYSHHSDIGHQLKSRAYVNHVLYNRIGDETGGDGSYQINVPNGGHTIIVGNQIHQSDVAGQGGIISVGEEGASNPTHELYVVNNTIVNDRHAGTFVRNVTSAQAVVTNNILYGPGTVLDGPGTATSNLEVDTDPGFVDLAGFDYHLLETSAAVDAGVDPGMAGKDDLWPARHYVHPAGDEPRPVVDALDVGAYEYGEAPGDDDTGDDDGGDDDTGDDDGGDDDGGDDDTGDDDGEDDDGGDDDVQNGETGCECRADGAATAASTTVPLLVLAAIAFGRGRRR